MLLIGVFELPVTCLVQPEKQRLIRSLDEKFLANLKEQILNDPSGPGVPPVACNCLDVQQDYSERLRDVYKYEVLGGHHTSTARAQLHEEQPDNPLFARVLCEVYVGLTDDEALRLSARHNKNGHYIHAMTHRDYVSFAVRLVEVFTVNLH